MTESTVIRNESGKFEKGNKCGGRKPIPQDIKQMFIDLVPEALQKIANIIRDSEDDKLVLDAAKVILDRAYGKPHQALDIDANVDNTMQIYFNIPRPKKADDSE